MLKVALSNSYYYKFDQKQWKNKTPFPPLGTLYAASFLRDSGYNVSVFDTNLIDDPKHIEAFLKQYKPNILVIYDDGFNYLTKMCLTKMREAAFEKIKIAKKRNIKVVISSSDSTDHYKTYIDIGADYVIQAEGEITLKELIEKLKSNEDISEVKGIVHKNGNTIIENPKRPVLRDLDVLPMPAWDLVDIESYRNIWNKAKQPFSLNIATTRGCPFKCNWCAKPIYGNRYNSHSPEYIVKQIKYLSETYKVNRFWMCDDIFGLKPKWVQNFNEELKKNELQISYYIQSRVDLLLKEDTIDALAESGLEEVWVGAESGSQNILDAMDKDTTVEQIYEATRILKSKHIRTAFFIQFGYLGETKNDINQTINMIKDLVPDDIGVSVSYPLPGTKFYEKVKEDLKLKANWTDSDDLDMMFQGTFNSKFYRKLQRYTHKEFRKSQAIELIKNSIKKPSLLNKEKLRRILLFFYYLPTSYIDRIALKLLGR